MNISKAAKISDLSVKTVRYYSNVNLVNPSYRTKSGYRVYRETDIRKLIFVRRAREFGFSIPECRELLDLYSKKSRTSLEVKKIAIKRYKTYEKSSEPVIDYYKQSNLLKVVNGEAGISEINSEIRGLIDTIKG